MKQPKVRSTTQAEELKSLQTRFDILEINYKSLYDSHIDLLKAFGQMVEAHNTHNHTIEWPQVMTLVLGPRVTLANIQMPK